jgi:hypothetical protein
MTTFLKRATEAVKSLFMRAGAPIVRAWHKLHPAKPRTIEIEYRRRSDSGTRRSAAIHIEARPRRPRV